MRLSWWTSAGACLMAGARSEPVRAPLWAYFALSPQDASFFWHDILLAPLTLFLSSTGRAQALLAQQRALRAPLPYVPAAAGAKPSLATPGALRRQALPYMGIQAVLIATVLSGVYSC